MVRIARGLRRFVRAGWRCRSVVGRGPVPGGLFRGGEGIHGVRSHPYGKGLTSTARDSHRGPARSADPVRRTKALTRSGPPSAVRRPQNPHRTSPEPARRRAASLMRGNALRAEPSIRGARAPGEGPWTRETRRPNETPAGEIPAPGASSPPAGAVPGRSRRPERPGNGPRSPDRRPDHRPVDQPVYCSASARNRLSARCWATRTAPGDIPNIWPVSSAVRPTAIRSRSSSR